MRLLPISTFHQQKLIPPVVLVAVIVTVYFPTLYGGVHPIDDPGIFARFGAAPPLSTLLLPGSGYYYRPLVEFSFWLDNLFWGLEPRTMHLESILLHCVNSMLVFLLARRCCSADKASPMLLPLLAALLFALHPVNVEAVAWIAGRTDLLLSLFGLASLLFWLRWLATPQWQNLLLAMLLLCASLLAKETAIAFAVVVVLCVLFWPSGVSTRQKLTAIGLLMIPVFVLVVTALLSRRGASALSRFITETDLLQTGLRTQKGLVALGFYAKKLVDPVPLNFAIDAVSPYYVFVGLLILPLIWLQLKKNRQAGIFILAALLCVLPAVLIAFNQVAWTPYAERYLYLPSALFLIGIACVVVQFNHRHQKNVAVIVVGLSVVFAVICFQRARLWQNKLAFFEDAVLKSPGFGSLYDSLGELLMQAGQLDRAGDAFISAERLNKRPSMVYPIKADIMSFLLAKGKYQEVDGYFYNLFKTKQEAPGDFLELLYKADMRRLDKLHENNKQALALDIIETLFFLNQKQPDPFWLYQSAKCALIAGNKEHAVEFFQRAYSDAPPDAHYREAAQKQFLRLRQAK